MCESEESESEESENEESESEEGDESEFEPLLAKRPCSTRSGRKKWASCIRFHSLVLYQHSVEMT